MRSLFFNLNYILFCLIFTIPLSAQTGSASEDVPITNLGTIHNEGEGVYIIKEYCLDDNNTLTVHTNIILGGLQIEGTSPDYYGVIPSNYPEMFIEYTINGVTYPPTQVGEFDLIELPENGNLAFSYVASSPTVDFTTECMGTTEGESDIYILTTVKFRLVTPNGSGWDIYPACDHAQPWGLFPCMIYDHAPWCDEAAEGFGAPDDPEENCYHEWYGGGFQAYLYCDCGSDVPTHDEEPIEDGDGSIIKDDESNNRDLIDRTTNVFPNPMDDILYIESGEFINKVEVFDARGNIVISNDYKGKRIDNLKLNTSDLPHGLYLVRIGKNSGTTLTKVLK